MREPKGPVQRGQNRRFNSAFLPLVDSSVSSGHPRPLLVHLFFVRARGTAKATVLRDFLVTRQRRT